MKIVYYVNGILVGYSKKEIECGDYCAYCGDCLHCYAGDGCYNNGGREHSDFTEKDISQEEFDKIILEENVITA